MEYPIVLVPATFMKVIKQEPADLSPLTLPTCPTPPSPPPSPKHPLLSLWLKPLVSVYQPLWQMGFFLPLSGRTIQLLNQPPVQSSILILPIALIVGLLMIKVPLGAIAVLTSLYIVSNFALLVMLPLQQYLSDLKRYQSAIAQWQQDCEQLRQQYLKHHAQWEQVCQSLRQQRQAQINQWRKQLVAQLLKQAKGFDGGQSDAPPGLAENPEISRFPVLLKQALGDHLHAGKKVGPYTPDFAYIDPKSGLHLDIEIDEPYSTHKVKGKDVKLPTHCTNGKSGKKDSDRNDFFLKRGWCVIRFSELQIFYQPEGCVREIMQLISLVLCQPELFAPYQHIPPITTFPAWNEAMSKKMAEQSFRVTYLKKLGIGEEPVSDSPDDDEAPPKRLVERNLPGKIRKD